MRPLFLVLLAILALALPALAAPPAAPTNLTAVATSATSIRLEWQDPSDDETGFQVLYRVGTSGAYSAFNPLAANETSLDISGTAKNTVYQFKVRAYKFPGPEFSTEAGPATAASIIFINGKLTQPFYFKIISRFPEEVIEYDISSLPPGLALNPTTGAITGTPTDVGRTDAVVTITHTGYPDAITPLTFEIFINPPALLPPAVSNPLPDLFLTTGTAATVITAAGVFTDPDVSSVARLTTDLGNIDFAFFPDAAPQTVANFLGYLGRGDFVNTMFHRSIPGFIIQGGAFRADATASAVPTQAPVINEPRISNLAGTVAMAKQGGNPNSATNQFFINLADNAANLDGQNEGFTVFARVAGNGMTVANAIAVLPRQNFATTNGALTDTPVRISPPPAGAVPYDPTQLVRISAASAIAPLSLIANSSTPAVASASVSGTDLTVTPISPGTTTITLTATDLDGQSVQTTFLLTVQSDRYPLWVERQSFALPEDANPTADPDHDGQSNLIEYALVSSPISSSPNAVSSIVQLGRLTGSFTVRRFLSDATVSLETATTLAGPWTTRWSLTDGADHPWIVNHLDFADSTLITFSDPDPAPPMRLFLRLKVTAP